MLIVFYKKAIVKFNARIAIHKRHIARIVTYDHFLHDTNAHTEGNVMTTLRALQSHSQQSNNQQILRKLWLLATSNACNDSETVINYERSGTKMTRIGHREKICA